MTSLSIILDSNQSGECIFRPGQLLKGTTILTLSNPRKFRGLSIRVFGHARTKFEIQGRRRTQIERGVEVFLNTNIYLFGRQDGPAFELGQGTHKYKFSCQLPEQLPNSTSLKHGTIEYFVEAVLEIPYLLDKEAKAPFIVDCDDLNYCEAISQPVRRVEMRNFSQYESLCTTIMLPCSGFVSNQTIPITIFYENNSSASIVRTKVALVQSIQYRNHDGSEVKSEKYILNENCAEGVTARNQKSVTTSLRINDVPMSITKFCGIISVKYTLEVEPELCANADDDKVYIPITIGKIPMAVTPQMIPIIMPVTPQRPRSIYATAPPPEQLNEELPPSYEELMRLKPF